MWTTRDIFSPPSQCSSTIVWKIHVSTRLVCLWVVSSQNAENDWTISCLSEQAWWFLCWNHCVLVFTIIASRRLLHLYKKWFESWMLCCTFWSLQYLVLLYWYKLVKTYRLFMCMYVCTHVCMCISCDAIQHNIIYCCCYCVLLFLQLFSHPKCNFLTDDVFDIGFFC